jgi:hypothetical protein
VTGIVRTFAGQLRDKWKFEVSADSPYLPWMVRHASFLHRRFQEHRNADGRTGYELTHGHPYRGELHEFGSLVMVMRTNALRPDFGKLEPRWEQGVWLGKDTQTDTHRGNLGRHSDRQFGQEP